MQTLLHIAFGLVAKAKAPELTEEYLASAMDFMEFLSLEHYSKIRVWLDVSIEKSAMVTSGGERLAKLGEARIAAIEPYLLRMLKSPPFPIDTVVGYGSPGEYYRSIYKRRHDAISVSARKEKVRPEFARLLSSIEAPRAVLRPLLEEKASILREMLNLKVIGQRQIIERVCKVIATSPPGAGKPRACFLLAGPQAAGKNVLANALAESLAGRYHVKRIDMSGYCNNENPGLVGVSSVYQSSQPGELTTFVDEHPDALLIFNNIENAHPSVQQRLLSILTQGKLRDEYWNSLPENERREKVKKEEMRDIESILNAFATRQPEGERKGKEKKAEIDFSRAILVFTTSCGELAYDNPFYNRPECPLREREAMLMQALRRDSNLAQGRYICKELLHALASFQVLPFTAMNLEGMRQLAFNNMRDVLHRFGNTNQCSIRAPEKKALVDMLIFSLGQQANPRNNSARAVEQMLIDPLENMLPNPESLRGKEYHVVVGATALRELAAIRQELGPDALQTLFRKRRMLAWKTSVKQLGNRIGLCLDSLRLVAVKHGEDFCGDGAMQIDVPEVQFCGIAGHDNVKARLLQMAGLMRQRERLQGLDVSLPKGLLLYGPPGTGKTMLAKAFANESDLPFMALSGTEIRDVDVMRRAFFRLRRYAPAVLFIDEIDALGKRGENPICDAVINQLLTEIDGFNSEFDSPVFVIGATNLPHKIDPALLRSGRLDMQIEVPNLDREARQMFVERYRAIPGLQGIDTERVLALTSGLSGADMEKVRRETVLEMARLGDAVATEIMLLEQISVVEQGYRRDKPISPQEREMAAWHEAGHAVLAFYLEPDLPVRKISIEARAGAQGAVMFDTELSRASNASTDWVMNRLCIALAGRYAESRQVGGSGMNSGAGQDMRRATELAYRAIFCWGLDDEVGTLALASGDAAIPDLAALPEWGLKRLRHWMEKAQQQTGDYLEQYWSDVEKIALALLKHDTLDGNTFRALLLAGRKNGLDVLKFQNCASPNVLSVRDKENSA